MSKREKIILVLMALTVMYGFYALFLESPRPRRTAVASGSKLDAFNKFITNVAELTKGGLSEIDSYIIEHIPSKWTKDPLLNAKDFRFDPDDKGTVDEGIRLGIKYSGFLEMGDRKLAIINGMEYESGEKLLDSAHIVGSIDPTFVTILFRGGKKSISIPLVEPK